jgi:8-oxo-dGTP diphosphatase
MNLIEKKINETIIEHGFADHKPEDRMSVAVIVKNSENKYLIMQRSHQDTDGAGLWDIVGGSVDSNDVHECALRELQEEANLEATELDYFTEKVYHCPWINDKKLRLIFQLETDIEPKVSFEHEQLKWVTIEELHEHEFFLDYLKEAVVEHHAQVK